MIPLTGPAWGVGLMVLAFVGWGLAFTVVWRLTGWLLRRSR